ncbi:MAG: YbgC/FadM family acyl-CoA thioesterase [Rhodospirillales bacterium]|nr:YbgC/FadM family acyl-CoA thioesterase [Rhodospirillales bacterium]
MTEPAMGHCHGGVHIFAARVYYEDTDAGGVAYHTSYLRLAERARTEMMRCMGFSHRELLERFAVLFALRRCAVDYRLPARLDDALEVRTRVTRVAGASFEGRQLILRGELPLVRVATTLACIAADGRPARLPAPVRAALEDLCITEGTADEWKAM